ncbi:hypothetical protein [Bifidobacterium vansinderenii]|uniref:MFS transporter n=1 Tax=Bifidobacterium vansinderenii TaxID=1984871 RepID=A0A229VYR2_9BIFI|nr:hypothetical protein [Bifidobacterium vansinderenii]OXN00763.1 MFS transporter [Bifidobacterium vansinderenii]
MKKSLIALAFGAFALGAAEFVMMGILSQAAHDMADSSGGCNTCVAV